MTSTQDDISRARAALVAVGAEQLGSQAVKRLAEAFAEARTADREQLIRLRAALGFYTTSTVVASWVGYELDDIGELARQMLAETAGPMVACGRGATLAALTIQLQAALERLVTARSQADEARDQAEVGGAGDGLGHLVTELDGKADLAYDEVQRLQAAIRDELDRWSRRAAA